ncbi:MAG: hypothetical protein ACREAM_01130 [Blastocatellia bacterium]
MSKTERIISMIIACLLALPAGVAGANAQDRRVERPRGGPERNAPDFGRRGPDSSEPGFRFISSEMRPDGRVVKGAPYSAEVVTESTQTLGNGTKLTRKTTALVYRDSEGRTRREQSAAPVGPFATAGDAPRVIFISDPVAGVSYTLFPDRRTASKRTLRPAPGASGRNFSPPRPRNDRPSSDERKTESLGKQVIEGVEAEGSRTTITIPAGRIGNDQPIEIVQERWYSPELQTTILNKHNDPRWGETVYKLTKINRSEPDHSLFESPSDYTVREEPVRRPFGGRGPNDRRKNNER